MVQLTWTASSKFASIASFFVSLAESFWDFPRAVVAIFFGRTWTSSEDDVNNYDSDFTAGVKGHLDRWKQWFRNSSYNSWSMTNKDPLHSAPGQNQSISSLFGQFGQQCWENLQSYFFSLSIFAWWRVKAQQTLPAITIPSFSSSDIESPHTAMIKSPSSLFWSFNPIQNSFRSVKKIQKSSPLYRLDGHMLHLLLSYLDAKELAIFSAGLSRKMSTMCCNEAQLSVIWKRMLLRRWQLSPLYLSCNNFWQDMADSKLRVIYPFSCPITSHWICDARSSPFLMINGLVAEYKGPVGDSNRSILGNQFIPLKGLNYQRRNSCISTSIAELITTVSNSTTNTDPSIYFITPFSISASQLVIPQSNSLRPRCIFYFEVTIDRGTEQSRNDRNTINDPLHLYESDCVAVGIATSKFLCSSRLPGWDRESYGYHGDDGAIFHGKGSPLRVYGPRFGVQDTVGCGVNLRDRNIFFTLNGMHLGVAFEDIGFDWQEKDRSFTPAIGLDSNCMLVTNFGEKPFVFNLSNFIHIQNFTAV